MFSLKKSFKVIWEVAEGAVGVRAAGIASSSAIWTRMTFADDTLSITVNGQHRRVPAGISVADLALELGLEPTRVAVERNLEVVPRSTLGQVRVEDGDDYEIVTFVGGG
jgi:thiamine biosynthesis protein ThiS